MIPNVWFDVGNQILVGGWTYENLNPQSLDHSTSKIVWAKIQKKLQGQFHHPTNILPSAGWKQTLKYLTILWVNPWNKAHTLR